MSQNFNDGKLICNHYVEMLETLQPSRRFRERHEKGLKNAMKKAS